ncbi:MAG: enoyl-CoA hydratase/isomerase family protein [Flavobacteriales bacterium]|nr:enoyl-CoA hydratase/isomerase family protein [Flavobacteriales bacterium]MCB9449320.1 enoyl-CoA hydratase/isomerase family protein [Flavobacteriales bacterium]
MSESTIMQEGGVEVAINKGIATVTFHHPKSNSLPGHVLKQLADTITELGGNDEARVIILQSKGDKAFCAGASFDELLSIEDFDTGKAFFMGFARVINAARKCPKFLIGRVQGKAVGGGVGMASAVDYCLAMDSASVKLSELAIGIGPFVVGPAVERKMGLSAFSDLAINATQWRDAVWAKEKGLYIDIFANFIELDAAVQTLAGRLSTSSPEAMALLKKAMWTGTDHWDQLLEERAAMSGQLVLSDFTSNAIRQFKEGAR